MACSVASQDVQGAEPGKHNPEVVVSVAGEESVESRNVFKGAREPQVVVLLSVQVGFLVSTRTSSLVVSVSL